MSLRPAPLDGTAAPRLLVSVRSASEAIEALRGGASIIDVKEPDAGALGAASVATCREVVDAVGSRVPVTAALGELVDLRSPQSFEVGAGVALYKLGMAGAKSTPWRETLLEWRSHLRQAAPTEAVPTETVPTETDLVAVAYADCERCDAPSVRDVFDLAVDRGFPYVLIDTFVKDGATLLDLLGVEEIAAHVSRAHSGGTGVVAAGSLSRKLFAEVAASGVDVIAVRGAATKGDRSDVVSALCVADLWREISRIRGQTASA